MMPEVPVLEMKGSVFLEKRIREMGREASVEWKLVTAG